METSDGTTGERISELFFKDIGWKMFRHQPRTKIVKIKNKLTVIYERSDGISDYTGYNTTNYNSFVACEVKECKGNKMFASRLDPNQRLWMKNLPEDASFVGICWIDSPLSFEIFRFKNYGSYIRKYGIIGKYYQ